VLAWINAHFAETQPDAGFAPAAAQTAAELYAQRCRPPKLAPAVQRYGVLMRSRTSVSGDY